MNQGKTIRWSNKTIYLFLLILKVDLLTLDKGLHNAYILHTIFDTNALVIFHIKSLERLSCVDIIIIICM